MLSVANTLKVFCDKEADSEADNEILALLGEPTEAKKWLAASLEKTIRLQLDPPTEIRETNALKVPDWIKKSQH
jgi:hypothetical protein